MEGPRILFPKKYTPCPLCEKQMRELATPLGMVSVCLREYCMIAADQRDPVFGKWNDALETHPKCPRCGTRMRMFFRSSDRFRVTQCPKCTKEGRMVEVRTGPVKNLPPCEPGKGEDG